MSKRRKPHPNQLPLLFDKCKGKTIVFAPSTHFLIQVGTNSKSPYKTKYDIVGDFTTALNKYEGIVLGAGTKKRLYACGVSKPILLKEVNY